MTRMWMVNPELMCRQHLLGEHKELHMIRTNLIKGRSIKGYLEKNCIEPSSLKMRHDDLVQEMHCRGYNHKTPFVKFKCALSEKDFNTRIDKDASQKELMTRCPACWTRSVGLEELA